MKTSITKNYSKIRFYTDVQVANCYTTAYWGTSTWRIRRNAAGEYVAYSSGPRTGQYPYIGGTRDWPQSPWGCGGAHVIDESDVAELLAAAQGARNDWSDFGPDLSNS